MVQVATIHSDEHPLFPRLELYQQIRDFLPRYAQVCTTNRSQVLSMFIIEPRTLLLSHGPLAYTKYGINIQRDPCGLSQVLSSIGSHGCRSS